MPKRSSKPKAKDENQIAFGIISKLANDEADVPSAPSRDEIRRVMALIGSIGGKKGGKARATSLSADRRAEIAKNAAEVRWGKKKALKK